MPVNPELSDLRVKPKRSSVPNENSESFANSRKSQNATSGREKAISRERWIASRRADKAVPPELFIDPAISLRGNSCRLNQKRRPGKRALIKDWPARICKLIMRLVRNRNIVLLMSVVLGLAWGEGAVWTERLSFLPWPWP